jgi:hypothetical protein
MADSVKSDRGLSGAGTTTHTPRFIALRLCAWAQSMSKARDLREEELASLRGERQKLTEQIRQSQETIERSQSLPRQIDELLAKSKT